jgi:hypothetical protein
MGKDPLEGLVKIAEDFDAGFSGGLAEHLKHARESERGVAINEDCAARGGRKKSLLGEPADVFGGEFDLCDVADVHQLRECGVEFRIGGKFLLVGENVSHGNGSGGGAEDETVLLLDFIESGHGDSCNLYK